MSTFNAIPLTTDSIYVIRDVAGQIQAGQGLSAEVLTSDYVWPNEVGEVPGKSRRKLFTRALQGLGWVVDGM